MYVHCQEKRFPGASFLRELATGGHCWMMMVMVMMMMHFCVHPSNARQPSIWLDCLRGILQGGGEGKHQPDVALRGQLATTIDTASLLDDRRVVTMDQPSAAAMGLN
ncbi:hypothetical protein PGT21_024141 [Puccinia graminis f. sp. tritici]|uniref:Uncharacterized protein n=1 Tax=Puccinia graminis f. sp. tritici TaxID=56615 RepID=A0A5B0P6B1_PUCGR|nr:hypothetical protein PGT21_024141 [Puccinia graminis f. sp. tritici]